MSAQRLAFPKDERLCSRKAIETLFAGGSRAFSAFPLRVVYKEVDDKSGADDMTAQVLISVSKRHFKHAVDRNRVKRQLREAWRLNRDIIAPRTEQLHIAFIWIADQLQPSDLIQRKMRKLLHIVNENTAKTNT